MPTPQLAEDVPDLAHPPLVVDRAGSGPPLLVLPGLGSTAVEFRSVLPALRERHDVLVVHLPGHGGSPALPRDVRPTVPALTDAVERELVRQGVVLPHVLGTSLGGRVGLELARRQRARSVVALGPTGPTSLPERAYQAVGLGAPRLLLRPLVPVAPLLLRPAAVRAFALAPLRVRGWKTDPDEAAELLRSYVETEDFWRLLRDAALREYRLDFRGVRCPVRIAQGSHDAVSLSQSLWLALLVPGARFSVLPFAGHSPVADVPERVVRLVEQAVRDAGQPRER